MPKRTLGERLERAQQRGNRAEQEIARLKDTQRKERTRRLIELGGLVAKASIDGLPTAALFDRFRTIAEAAKNPDAVAAWERAGARFFEDEAPPQTRIGAMASFPGKIPPEVAAQLRALGFRWNRLRSEWEGYVAYEAARVIVEGAGGTLRRAEVLAANPPAPKPPAIPAPRGIRGGPKP